MIRQHTGEFTILPQTRSKQMIDDGMMGMGMMMGMGLICLLVVVALVLGIAALIKYLRKP